MYTVIQYQHITTGVCLQCTIDWPVIVIVQWRLCWEVLSGLIQERVYFYAFGILLPTHYSYSYLAKKKTISGITVNASIKFVVHYHLKGWNWVKKVVWKKSVKNFCAFFIFIHSPKNNVRSCATETYRIWTRGLLNFNPITQGVATLLLCCQVSQTKQKRCWGGFKLKV